jgi:hypothetical protein
VPYNASVAILENDRQRLNSKWQERDRYTIISESALLLVNPGKKVADKPITYLKSYARKPCVFKYTTAEHDPPFSMTYIKGTILEDLKKLKKFFMYVC